ncbi:MAG: uncharacterized protein JWM88_1723 [Verrucomicrobia bacterium]|nr:uncharacterized protein [Verrucomicrobiota bacterium]
MNGLFNQLVRLRMAWVRRTLWASFVRRTQDPAFFQQQALRSILRRNENTAFGRAHGFAGIGGSAEYATKVPIQTYEDLRPYIEKQEADKTPHLVAEQPVMYARTSGTTGKPKYIPLLASTIASYRRNQEIFSYCHYSAVPGIFSGKTLAFVSPAIEGRLPSGTPFGSMSGLIYQSTPKLLQRNYVIPPAVFECADSAVKYLLIAIFAAAEDSISYIAGANPSTFLKIAEVIPARIESIIAAIRTGQLPGREQLGPATHRVLQQAFGKNEDRACVLERLAINPERITLAALWPKLKAISCWREGSCRLLLPALQRQLPPGMPILEMGYLSSECRGSLPVDSLRHLEVPTLHENYFEFIERDAWESGSVRTCALEHLEIGRLYYVIITTPAGLYRYFMNDIVMAGVRHGNTPTIKFLEKGTGATNITGEKLYESQVCDAVDASVSGRSWHPAFFVMIADPARQRYVFYLEAEGIAEDAFLNAFEAEIFARNLEYKAKRESGRLHPIELKRLRPGAGESFKAHLLAQGQREAQFKFLRLQSLEKVTFDFDAQVDPLP